jgi:BMFP domain-containing protein YqiC
VGIEIITNKKDNMFEATKELQQVSLRTLDMINKNADNLGKLAEFLNTTQEQLNALGLKVVELEKRLEKNEPSS